MDLNEKRKIEDELLDFVEDLEYQEGGNDDGDILLLGSAGMKSQEYFSDYDLFTTIDKFNLKKIVEILKRTEKNQNMYLIEVKFQRGNKKVKFKTLEELEKKYDEIADEKWDFIKCDFIIYIDYKLIELSIIYDTGKKGEDPNGTDEDLEERLNDDIKEYKKDGMYYKALKRTFSLLNYRYKMDKNNKKLEKKVVMLSKFFNSEFGKLYSIFSNLEAIKLMIENYDDIGAKKRIELNLKDIGVKEENLEKTKRELSKLFNEKAKIYL